MKMLVVGGGGREHALAWKLLQSSSITAPYRSLSRPATPAQQWKMAWKTFRITTIPELLEFAKKEAIAFTVVGPEAPLAAGIVDAFRAAGLKIFGPTKQAAQLESSKDFAKAFMQRHGIPTAAYAISASAEEAHRYLDEKGAPIVIKADGLAAGKGVVVATTLEEAHAAVDAMLVDNQLGDAGARVVIEEFLEGEEVSFIVMADGRHVLPLATSQDHKRLKAGDPGRTQAEWAHIRPRP